MQAILQTCIDVEERVGEIYRKLVNHPDADDELREIWQQMADDEKRHAQRIRLVRERFEKAGVIACNLTLDDVQQLLERAAEILQKAQHGSLSLEEAIYASVELEDAFLAAHLGFAASGNQPDLQTMFKSLAEADREHTERLISYLKRLHDGDGLVFSDGGETL
ncbi:MAG: ferritin family protein [Desulfuromonadales bacterium]|nr:ferritin family protein [Desulfuromonadales bacterium]